MEKIINKQLDICDETVVERRLDQLTNALFLQRGCGLSFYEMAVMFMKNRGEQGRIKLPDDIFEYVNKESILKWNLLLQGAVDASAACGTLKGHVYSDFHMKEYSEEKKEIFLRYLKDLKNALDSIKESYTSICEIFALRPDGREASLNILYEFVQCLLESDEFTMEYVFDHKLEQTKDLMEYYNEHEKYADCLEAEFALSYQKSVMKLPYELLLDEWMNAEKKKFLGKILEKKKVLKQIQSVAKKSTKVTEEEVVPLLKKLQEYDGIKAEMNAIEDELPIQYRTLLEDNVEDRAKCMTQNVLLQKCIEALSWENEVRQNFEMAIKELMKQFQSFKFYNATVLESYVESYGTLKDIFKQMHEVYGMREIHILKGNFFEEMNHRIIQWDSEANQLQAWCAFQEKMQLACEAGLGTVMDAFSSGRILKEKVIPCFECNLAFGLILKTMEEDDALRGFDSEELEQAIDMYQKHFVYDQIKDSEKQKLIEKHFDCEDDDAVDPILKMIADELTRYGLQVEPCVDKTGFSADLIVKQADSTNKAKIGIMLDSSKENRILSCKERYGIKECVLKANGWSIYHVWTIDWFMNPGKEVRKILQFAKSA